MTDHRLSLVCVFCHALCLGKRPCRYSFIHKSFSAHSSRFSFPLPPSVICMLELTGWAPSISPRPPEQRAEPLACLQLPAAPAGFPPFQEGGLPCSRAASPSCLLRGGRPSSRLGPGSCPLLVQGAHPAALPPASPFPGSGSSSQGSFTRRFRGL